VCPCRLNTRNQSCAPQASNPIRQGSTPAKKEETSARLSRFRNTSLPARSSPVSLNIYLAISSPTVTIVIGNHLRDSAYNHPGWVPFHSVKAAPIHAQTISCACGY